MKCQEAEILLCEYSDGLLGPLERRALESHLAACADCAGLVRDAAGAVAFLERVEPVEPPDALITRILFQTPEKTAARPGGALDWLRGLLRPLLQPKFAMGMAMTILSFSMIGRLAGIEQRPLQAADLDPARIWSEVDVTMHRAWDRALKYYENLRLVYAIRNTLEEWSAREEQIRAEEERKARRSIEPAQSQERNGKP